MPKQSPSTSRSIARLAAWVILLAALMPTVSHWLQSFAGVNPWSEICSTRFDTRPDGASPLGSSDKPIDSKVHCPFCLPHDGNTGLLPDIDDSTVHLLALSHAEPFLFLHAPQPLFVWGSSQARAPPTRSV